MNQSLYPAGPDRVFEEKLHPSPAFRRQALKVAAAIILFIVTYFALLATATLLAIGCGYAGLWLISTVSFFGILLGIALIFLGLAVLYFLIKFAFARQEEDKSDRQEISEQEQPELFAFIRQLSKDTGAPFPQKIFLSPAVNASVFYRTSFRSMFLPERKNLEIGLGLINSLNLSEFKAVMAHEFGHFSQRSLKLGSFTYNANRIIYNMLNENNSYNEFLSSVGNVHTVFAIFAHIIAGIANTIRAILNVIYGIINKSYMALSREMEYHADTVAASVAGGNNLISSLARTEVAADCYQYALDSANEWLADKKQYPVNIFSNQLSYYQSVASEYYLPLKNGLPDISYAFVTSFGASRIRYNEQWASHPTLLQRKTNLEAANMNAAPDESSAWVIFRDAEKLQESFTRNMCQEVAQDSQYTAYSNAAFDQWVKEKTEAKRLPAAYKGFYDKRIIDPRDHHPKRSAAAPAESFDALFNDTNARLWTTITSNQKDVELLKSFQVQDTGFKSFDFDGVKYTIDDCYNIIAQLEVEINAQLEQQHQLDQQARDFFFTHAGQRRGELEQAWLQYKQVYEIQEERRKQLEAMGEKMQYILNEPLSRSQLCQLTDKFIQEEEASFKTLLQQLSDQPDSPFDEPLAVLCREFIASGHRYYDDANNVFLQYEIQLLGKLINKLNRWWYQQQFAAYKSLLETQLRIYEQMHAPALS